MLESIGDKRRRWLPLGIGLLGVLSLGLYLHTPRDLTQLVAAESLELGEIGGTTHVVSLPLHNSSVRAVEISAIYTSCGCTQIRPTKLRIPALATRKLEVELDVESLAGRGRATVVKQAVPFQVTLTPEIEGVDLGVIQWVLKGSALPPRVADASPGRSPENTSPR